MSIIEDEIIEYADPDQVVQFHHWTDLEQYHLERKYAFEHCRSNNVYIVDFERQQMLIIQEVTSIHDAGYEWLILKGEDERSNYLPDVSSGNGKNKFGPQFYFTQRFYPDGYYISKRTVEYAGPVAAEKEVFMQHIYGLIDSGEIIFVDDYHKIGDTLSTTKRVFVILGSLPYHRFDYEFENESLPDQNTTRYGDIDDVAENAIVEHKPRPKMSLKRDKDGKLLPEVDGSGQIVTELVLRYYTHPQWCSFPPYYLTLLTRNVDRLMPDYRDSNGWSCTSSFHNNEPEHERFKFLSYKMQGSQRMFLIEIEDRDPGSLGTYRFMWIDGSVFPQEQVDEAITKCDRVRPRDGVRDVLFRFC